MPPPLTEKQGLARLDVLAGYVCPYCGSPTKLVSSSSIYGDRFRDVGPMWRCGGKCEAWVSCHPGTEMPLGRLADKTLRRFKSQVHEYLDPLWIVGPRQERKARRIATYKWLAAAMGIEPAECHVGMFDVEQCRRAIEICRAEAIRRQRAREQREQNHD